MYNKFSLSVILNVVKGLKKSQMQSRIESNLIKKQLSAKCLELLFAIQLCCVLSRRDLYNASTIAF